MQKENTSTPVVQNFFHCTGNNIGDRLCGPAQYVWPERHENLPLRFPKSIGNRIILGGGQIFGQMSELVAFSRIANPDAKIVAWGVGLPLKNKRSSDVRLLIDAVDLFGTRNYGHHSGVQFVPCASCLSPHFDEAPEATREVVAFLHRRKGEQIELPKDVPTMTNEMEEHHDAIKFIAQGETVITSSYHGVYWAQLLRRRVICIPYNEKFFTFQHMPTFATAKDWRSKLKSATRGPEILQEYRDINRKFATRVTKLWGE